MEKERAIELLIQAVDEIPHLKTLHYQNDEIKLWLDKVGNILRAGLKPEDYSKYWPVSQALEILKGVYEDNIYQEEYLKKVTNYEIALKSILLKYEVVGMKGKRDKGGEVEKEMVREAKVKMVLSKESDILGELSNFSLGLKQYEAYRIIHANKGLKQQEYREMMSLRERLNHEVGRFGSLITELTGKGKIHTVGKGPEFDYDMWAAALRIEFNKTTLNALRICIDYTDRTIGKLESDINEGVRDKQGKKIGEPSERPVESPLQIFDAMQFHPKIIQASKSLFEDEYYAQAIFEAFKAVENFVREKSGLSSYGKNLMATAFNEENPIIKVPEAGYFDKDVQEGFKFLFMGATQGIRNPKAHKEIVQNDPFITLEYLGLASFLLKRIDYWEADIS